MAECDEQFVNISSESDGDEDETSNIIYTELLDTMKETNAAAAASTDCPTSSTSQNFTNNEKKTEENYEKDPMECPICLQTCIHPARLPCGHIFCFLCVKGVANKNRRCAMCRRQIPAEFLDHPQLVHGMIEHNNPTTEDGYQWFYEGRNGWWQYDERTSQDIEEAYKKSELSCTILVAGYVYIVDFGAMIQQRQNDPSRRRHVKRDLATIPKKGVAGLRIDGGQQSSDENGTTTPSTSTSSSNFISTIAADAAIRIASDIIDSTLAHQTDGGNDISTDDQFSSAADGSQVGNSSTAQQRQRRQQLLLDEVEQLLEINDLAAIPIADHLTNATADLFSQTLEDFRSLTLRNVIDSSDSEEDNEQILL